MNQDWINLASHNGNCKRCQLADTCTNKVFGEVGTQTKVIFIGEAPGEEEDIQGMPFVGRGGKLLRKWISEAGLKDGEYSILNTVCCRPPQNRKPSPVEISMCDKWLKAKIKLLGCNKIIVLGSIALGTLVPSMDGVPILQEVGKVIYYNEYNVFVMPHPAYVLRNMAYKIPVEKMRVFVQ